MFFSLSKLNNVVNMFIEDSFVDNIRTKDLVDLGQSVQGVNAGRITFVTVPTTGYADDYGNEQPRVDDMAALFEAIINDDPLPEETQRRQHPGARDPRIRQRHNRTRPTRTVSWSTPWGDRTRRGHRAGCRTRRENPDWPAAPPTCCSNTDSTSTPPMTTPAR